MKNAFIIALLIFSTIASATDYYISSAGNDSNNGLSPSTPWKTITKVNSIFTTLKPGDRILFNRGDTFYGTITVTKSGSAGNPITIGAYGTGANPIITGFTTIIGWTNEGNGIYSKVISSEAQTNMVTIDGVNTRMGRYPKSTYLTYESFSTNVSITDNGLGDATNWTGAEVVIRKNDWTLDRCTITNHTGDVLTYTSLGTNLNATAKYGYFIQNDLRCVTNYGDWYHNKSTGKFYMYFGTVNPSTKTVKVATLNNLITNQSGGHYVTLNNISLSGSIENAVNYTWQNDYCIIQNCSITYAGREGIRLFGDFGTVDNNQITNCNGFGIYSYGLSAVITNNTLTNISIIAGQSKGWQELVGIFVEKNNCLVQYNKIENSGYNGIAIGAAGNNITVQNNFIHNPCLILNDGGGIYLSGTHSSIKIDGNIILNALGSNTGTPNATLMAEGIYLDENANHITVTNNTVANCANSGIKLNKAHDNTVLNNTTFNNYTGIDFENWTGNTSIYNNTMTGNIFFAKASTQFTLRFSSVTNDIPAFGTANNNYYSRPIDDNYVIYTNQTSIGPKNRTLGDWQLFTKQDANSHKSPIAVINANDIRFEYNELKTNKIVTLVQPMIDVKGSKFVNSITLLPYTSVVLMVDPNPAQQVIPIYTGSVINDATPSLLEITYNVNLSNIVPATSAFTVQVNSIARTINAIAISGTKVQLTLASPVVYGDIITVDYTKPSTNPLQTTSGGQAASFIAQTVINKVVSLTFPTYISSSIENVTPSLLVMTYNMALANLVPAASGFSVNVNSAVRTVNAVVVSGTKVQLTLTSPIVYGDVVTFSYTKPSSNPLQTESGGIAASISNQMVINNCINIAPTVNQPPVVEISNPLKGNEYETNSTITLEAFASDPDGSISKVEFYSGSDKLVELTTPPYSYTWKDVKAGTYSITAVAMDNLNTSTTSLPLEFEVGTTIKYDANSDIITLYPNPNDGHFSIEFITQLQNEKSEIVITDLAGKQVYAGPVLKEETLKQFDLSNIKSGIYVMMINDKEKLVTKKIIIQ